MSTGSSPRSNPPAWATPAILATCKPGERLYRCKRSGWIRAFPSGTYFGTEGQQGDSVYSEESRTKAGDESYTVPAPAQACDGSGKTRTHSGMFGIDIEEPCPGCDRCKPAKHDDGAEEVARKIMREYVGTTRGLPYAEDLLRQIVTAAIRADRAAREPRYLTSVKVNMTREQIDGLLRVRNETGRDIKAGTLVYFSPDDAAFREKVRELCKLAMAADAGYSQKPGDLPASAKI